MKSGGMRSEASGRSRSSYLTPTPSRMTPITERSVSFDDSADYSDAKEDDEDDYLEEKALVSKLSEGAVVSVGHSACVKALARNLAEELEEVAGPVMDSDDDGSDGAKPSAVIEKTLELMKTKSSWMQMFEPTLVRQAVWMNLGGELVVPIDSTSTRQVVQDTVMLLRAMRCEPQRFPPDAALEDWAPADAGTALRKWKKKLRTAFGMEEIAPGHQTPIKCNETSQGVFGSKGSPYMHDSHMVTPRFQADRRYDLNEDSSDEGDNLLDNDCLEGDITEEWARQIRKLSAKETKNSTPSQVQQADRRYDLNEDSSDEGDNLLDNDCLEGDITEEWARQIRKLSAKETKNSTPSEKSMQWLRTFIYEIKGTHTPPNDWRMAFELTLQDGALHWYRQLPRKTRRTWKLLSDAFIKYYCSKFNQSAKATLNGYARNAGVQFENGGRESKNHVEHFLDMCDDRGLEERLYHVRVKDIHDLEDMINDILKRRDRTTKRETSVKRSHSHDNGRRRDSGRNKDSRGSFRRDNHHRDDRRRDESPYWPRITLADALSHLVTALNETSVGPRTSQSGQYDHGYETNEDSLGDGEHRNDNDN
ncbi:hypothetical protein PHMEG_00024244 [Phytophthora megakarya]|uniref:Retrotransposon gag domain-containing protein n=1 Tax=Phytophthora megakarya TaxID=4795 RepID=A0A225VF54_9STRA|nr:hypothetical protein PHMEG_00024244 [Phytophthora megakarya]